MIQSLWKDAASLLLAARHRVKPKETSSSVFTYDYQLLALKRHQNSSFMPGAYVFPGGTTESADADLKWNKLFAAFGFDQNNFKSLIPNTNVRPPIFKKISNELPREISLRITAIRETFEECGILLCKRSTKVGFLKDWAENLTVTNRELEEWQNKVHNDPTEFYKLCEGLQCYPDLWSLHEWSNWLTPTNVGGKRFDTVFYLACLPEIPDAKYEETEMEDLIWANPKNLINSTSSVLLMPPQQYELARLAKFESLDNLLEFAVDRSKMGVHLNFPVKVKLLDGTVFLLPGDSLYPKHVSFIEKNILDKSTMTINELRNDSTIKNRLEFYDLEIKKIIVHNHENIDGHLSPLPVQTVRIKPSKL
ncbi:acyl-coenzyme A diphosphatase NUDT19 isoform X2 [Leptopilina boulardi]|uniref:acyl-coenzyme A diphosphatase NUDT19 isoform X2 n=1 Tax=Leptopilina boulardi TaxID=63433 RepID=UPI0021F5D270|nr:acyl-coenzyme A diphosphatase NUDT19 isoform X2 [Leptopilina boulardi]